MDGFEKSYQPSRAVGMHISATKSANSRYCSPKEKAARRPTLNSRTMIVDQAAINAGFEARAKHPESGTALLGGGGRAVPSLTLRTSGAGAVCARASN